VQPDSSFSLQAIAVLAVAEEEDLAAAEVDLAALAEAVLAVAELVEAGKCNPALQQALPISPNPTLGAIQEFLHL
jgi:hypothetical protein